MRSRVPPDDGVAHLSQLRASLVLPLALLSPALSSAHTPDLCELQFTALPTYPASSPRTTATVRVHQIDKISSCNAWRVKDNPCELLNANPLKGNQRASRLRPPFDLFRILAAQTSPTLVLDTFLSDTPALMTRWLSLVCQTNGGRSLNLVGVVPANHVPSLASVTEVPLSRPLLCVDLPY